MKIIGLDGKQYNWNPLPQNYSSNSKSNNHLECRALLKTLFPSDTIIEEVHLPGSNTRLFVDFYVPFRKLMVEVHGQQHYKMNKRFHKNQLGFNISKARDKDKINWIESNGFKFVELPDDQKDDWRNIIINILEGN